MLISAKNNFFASIVNARVEYEYKVSCSYIEIYNERIFDLLDDLSNPDQVRDYKREKVTEIEVTSEADALNILFTGELARTTATHRLNRKSNRSHSLFTVYIEQRQRSGISERVVHSKLVLTDLAGSERLKKTMSTADGYDPNDEAIRKESMCINQSLTYLEQCVVALSKKGVNHVPYRQSKLTTILKDCLGANCNTLMVACIWGEAEHLEETVSTLRLATRMMRVQNETAVTESVDPSALIRKQERMIKALKQELLMHDALVERTGVAYDPFTPEQQSGIITMIERFMDAKEEDEEDVLRITSVRQMIEICKQFKRLLTTARAEVEFAREENSHLAMSGGFSLSRGGDRIGDLHFAETKIAEEYDPKKQSYVGIPEEKPTGFALGIAPPQARPLVLEYAGVPANDAVSPTKSVIPNLRSPKPTKDSGGNSTLLSTIEAGSPDVMVSEDPGLLYESFITTAGAQQHSAYSEWKNKVRELKLKCKETSAAVNSAKAKIDDLQRKIEVRKESRIELLRKSGFKASEAAEIVDEEELSISRDLKEAKRAYKSAYENLQRLRVTLNDASDMAAKSKEELSRGFLSWMSSQTREMDFYPESTDESSDTLDNQENFEKMEMQRVLAAHPGKHPAGEATA